MTVPLVDLARVVIYDRDAVTVRGTVAGIGLSWSQAKDTDGTVTFSVNAVEAALAADPGLLDDALGMVEMRLTAADPWVPVFPFVCQPGSGTIIGPAEAAARDAIPVAKGALWLTSEMLVLHEPGVINRRGTKDRFKGWMSPEYDDSAWIVPRNTARSTITAGLAKYGQPHGWADPGADWIDDPLASGSLFRSPPFTVTVAELYQVTASADEEYRLFLGEQLIIEEKAQETGYTKARVWEEVLPPGTYTLAAEMTSIDTAGGDGYDALSVSVCTVDAANRPVLPAVLNTGPDWLVKAVPLVGARPGLTVGQILGSFLDENVGWGIAAAGLLTRTFTDLLDSAGTPWPAGLERSWAVGTTLAQVIADLTLTADFDVAPDWTLNAYITQGQDRTATVALQPGTPARAADENLIGYTWAGDPLTATRALVLTQDGYTTVIDAALEAAHAPRAVYVESTQSVGVAAGIAVGQAVLDAQGRRTYTAHMIAVAGCVPFADFGIGDTITGLDAAGSPAPLQVVSISGAQDQDPPVLFTVELKETV